MSSPRTDPSEVVHAIDWSEQSDIRFACDGAMSQSPWCADPKAATWRADNGRLFAREAEDVTCVLCHQSAARSRRIEADKVAAAFADRKDCDRIPVRTAARGRSRWADTDALGPTIKGWVEAHGSERVAHGARAASDRQLGAALFDYRSAQGECDREGLDARLVDVLREVESRLWRANGGALEADERARVLDELSLEASESRPELREEEAARYRARWGREPCLSDCACPQCVPRGAEVEELRAELAEVRGILNDARCTITGNSAAPTDPEIAAWAKYHGRWRCVVIDAIERSRDMMLGSEAATLRDALAAEGLRARWWAVVDEGSLWSWERATGGETTAAPAEVVPPAGATLSEVGGAAVAARRLGQSGAFCEVLALLASTARWRRGLGLPPEGDLESVASRVRAAKGSAAREPRALDERRRLSRDDIIARLLGMPSALDDASVASAAEKVRLFSGDPAGVLLSLVEALRAQRDGARGELAGARSTLDYIARPPPVIPAEQRAFFEAQRQVSDLSEDADRALAEGNRRDAAALYEAATALELRVLATVPPEKARTRAIIAKSAEALAHKARAARRARSRILRRDGR